MANPCGNVPRRPRSSIMGGIQQFTFALMNALPGHKPNQMYLEIARSHGVTELKSVGNCEEAKQWLEKMEYTLEAMKCPLNEWANTVGFFIQGDARSWWKSTKESRPPGSWMTLAAFRKRFITYFLSPSYRLRKRRLARHHDGTYDNPQAQMDHAMLALNQEYCTLVATQRPRTYEEVPDTLFHLNDQVGVQGHPVKLRQRVGETIFRSFHSKLSTPPGDFTSGSSYSGYQPVQNFGARQSYDGSGSSSWSYGSSTNRNYKSNRGLQFGGRGSQSFRGNDSQSAQFSTQQQAGTSSGNSNQGNRARRGSRGHGRMNAMTQQDAD
ncbi:hypothetical protein ACFX1Q_000037 [Malus domestica]